ncbi:haloacid dehalogenase-like hydrolase [Streptomyces sp. NPDC051976]|uniref:haloacid dehalogenase-like hydrolase n=1 Tax=Streptomyces sp. NPDC051976 TaxID=3154947 RepID=UPI0034378E46
MPVPPVVRSRRRTRLTCLALALLATAFAPASASAAPDNPSPRHPCATLSDSPAWYGTNRARIQQVVDLYAPCGAAPTRARRTALGGTTPVAVFDWDNTVVKNDVGDALLYWVLREDKVLHPADWSSLNSYLTPAADRALSTACDASAAVGEPLPTATDTGCADEIYAVYHNATTGGEKAFAGYDHRLMSPGSAWVAELLTGHTAAEIASYAERARAQNLAAPVGTTQQVGSHHVTGWIRYYAEQRDLIHTLTRDGYAVWVASASPQIDVQVWAAGLGIPPDRVLGIQSLYAHGRQTPHLRGCGDIPDGADSVLTYVSGKRCFVNQDVFGIHGAAAFRPAPPGRHAVLAAGDSATDVVFVGDAIGVRLAVNRNAPELMCRAYDDADGRWLVNPMFLQPLPRRATPYPCSTTGYTNPDGSPGPVRRDDGSIVPDQADTVF